MDGTSLTPEQEKINALRQILPEAFSEGKIDWEKLKATLGANINFSNERYVLNWAGKSDAFKVLQTPTTKTLVPCPEESLKKGGTSYAKGETFSIENQGNHKNQINHGSDNIFIEGENLEVLKVLQKSYFGKVKMIYIDPPYNTGNDSFIYPDKFSERKADYEKRVGDKDEEGYMTKDGMFKKNSKENGQYHSNWLNMMMPRLYLAKNLLKQDGVIFVSIDDNEVHNLRLLMNEIFGEENFVAQFVWKRRQNVDSRAKNGASTDHEYIITYKKSENGLLRGAEKDLDKYSNPDNDLRGDWMSADMTGLATKEQRPNLHYDLKDPKTDIIYDCPPTGWRYEPKRMNELIKNKEIIFPKNPNGRPRRKKFQNDLESEFTGFSTVLKTVFNTQGTREVRNIFDDKEYFDFPKPKDLLKIIIEQGSLTKTQDIILDFFAGSGTIAHAVMDLNVADGGNRKYICVQLAELLDEKSESYKAGFKTIADVSKERIRRTGKKVKEEINVEIKKIEIEVSKLQSEIATNETKAEIENLKTKIDNLKTQDLGFKVLKLEDSNFKQWQQIKGKDAIALAGQMKLFVDPVSESATIENMVYELLLKSGKDLSSRIEKKESYYQINGNELVLLLEKASQELMDLVMAEKPKKVIALDKLFKGNDQLKTNTVLQMRDAGIEFKTI
ncbi:MAG: site-specific DNA-methyltransferase [Ginsengibacter sp.]